MASLSSFITRILPDVIGCPKTFVEMVTIDTVSDFCEKTWVLSKGFNFTFEQSDIDTELNNSIDIDFGELSLTSTDSLIPCGIKKFCIDGIDCGVLFKEITNHVSNLESIYDVGCHKLYYFPSISAIRMYPFSRSASLFIELALKTSPDATTIPDMIYNHWMETIIAGVKYRLFSMPGKDWANEDAALVSYTLYRQGISEARTINTKNRSSKSRRVQFQRYGEI